MLKSLYAKLEERFFYGVVRVVRGAMLGGRAQDATLDDIIILHESPNYIVLNKHHDVLVNSVKRELVTVERQLERLYPDLVSSKLPFGFYFPHRIDYSTSGILCIAKTKRACAAATKAFSLRNTQKYYLALLRGHLAQNFVTMAEAIGEDTRPEYDGVRMASESMPYCHATTRKARTHLLVLEKGTCYGDPATKVLLRPITGRRHQLRIHCHNIGHTIVGDYTYSDRKDVVPYRMFLHAVRLKMQNDLEDLDIIAKDLFVQEDPKNHWVSAQSVLSMDDAVYELSCKE